MNHQRHIIKRQLIEITTGSQSLAESAQTEISRFFSTQLIKLIDKNCTNYSNPDTVHRIESLELDLGTIVINNLEKEFKKRLDNQLKKKLPQYINQETGGYNDDTQPINKKSLNSQLELFGYFAGNGYLPWWADGNRSELMEDCMDSLLQAPASLLSNLFHNLINEKQSMMCIIRYYGDHRLKKLVKLLRPGQSTRLTVLAGQLITVLPKSERLKTVAGYRIREAVWYAVLTAASGKPALGQKNDVGEILHHISRQLDLNFTVLYQALRSLDATIFSKKTALADPQAGMIDFSERLLELTTRPFDLQTLNEIQTLLHKQAAPRFFPEEILNIVSQLKFEKTVSNDLIKKVDEIIRMAAERLDAGKQNDTQNSRERTDRDDPLKCRFSTSEEIYIGNAGIVILWPFLESFFDNMQWLQNKQFINDRVQQTALTALHYLANGEPTAKEFMLPLNKILCGMQINDLYEAEQVLTQTEKKACDELLDAVIKNAPILKNTSIDGFRGSFLMRQGILKQRDGAWLLRVERETHDIILDRFPWGIEWVKLPWMPLPMRVEW